MMYKILNDDSASSNLVNNQTDLTLPNPKTEYLKHKGLPRRKAMEQSA